MPAAPLKPDDNHLSQKIQKPLAQTVLNNLAAEEHAQNI
jgi:hypothetical protein